MILWLKPFSSKFWRPSVKPWEPFDLQSVHPLLMPGLISSLTGLSWRSVFMELLQGQRKDGIFMLSSWWNWSSSWLPSFDAWRCLLQSNFCIRFVSFLFSLMNALLIVVLFFTGITETAVGSSSWLPRVFVRVLLWLLRRHSLQCYSDEELDSLCFPSKHETPGSIHSQPQDWSVARHYFDSKGYPIDSGFSCQCSLQERPRLLPQDSISSHIPERIERTSAVEFRASGFIRHGSCCCFDRIEI